MLVERLFDQYAITLSSFCRKAADTPNHILLQYPPDPTDIPHSNNLPTYIEHFTRQRH